MEVSVVQYPLSPEVPVLFDGPERSPRETPPVNRRCVVCGAAIESPARYCQDHEYLRNAQLIATHDIQVWQDREVEFTELSSAEILLSAAMSIRILRPDGTCDKARTETERGRWLTAKLNMLRVQNLMVREATSELEN